MTGGAITLATIGLFAASNFRLWAWLAIAFLLSWAVAFAWTARVEHGARVVAENRAHEVMPPGHPVAWMAPLEYQEDAVRQCVAKMRESNTPQFALTDLDVMLAKLQRQRTDPVYEPLSGLSCEDGLAKLVERGELRSLREDPRYGPWEIVKKR